MDVTAACETCCVKKKKNTSNGAATRWRHTDAVSFYMELKQWICNVESFGWNYLKVARTQVLTLTFLFKPAIFKITFTRGIYSNNNQNNYEWLHLHTCFVVACYNFPKQIKKNKQTGNSGNQPFAMSQTALMSKIAFLSPLKREICKANSSSRKAKRNIFRGGSELGANNVGPNLKRALHQRDTILRLSPCSQGNQQ